MRLISAILGVCGGNPSAGPRSAQNDAQKSKISVQFLAKKDRKIGPLKICQKFKGYPLTFLPNPAAR